MKLEPFTSDPGAEGYQLPPTQTNWFTWMFELFFSTLFFFFFFGGISFVLWVVFIRSPWRAYVAIRLQRAATNQAAAKKRHYINQDESQLGPFSYDELQKYLDEEVFSVKDLAAEEGGDEWVPLGIYMDSFSSQFSSGHKRQKLPTPRIIAFVGCVLLVLACLFPPVSGGGHEGRAWMGLKSRGKVEVKETYPDGVHVTTYTVYLDFTRLLIDCGIILATTSAGVVLTGRRKMGQ